MEQETETVLKRDCNAVQIPAGTEVTLPQGTPFQIAQTLGGSYTIYADSGMYRIQSTDADALGETPPQESSQGGQTGGEELTDDQVWETLKTCYDPEIPVNIVDLGLVYDMAVSPAASGKSRVDVKMTLTAPGCGMGPTIAGDAQQKLETLDGVEEANVELVWDPPWHPSMISDSGKRALGIE